MQRNSTHLLIAGACVATAGLTLFLLRRRHRIQWTENAATVKQLVVYPIKSVPGMEVQRLEVTPSGVVYGVFYDRSMVLLNSEERMLTLRHEPRLALIRMKMTEDEKSFVMTAPEMEDLTVSPRSAYSAGEKVFDFVIWSASTQGVEVSADVSHWFSKFLGREVTLVQHMSSFPMRPSSIESKKGKVWDKSMQTRYQDECPVYMVNEASIEELDKLRPEDDRVEFTARCLRGNILITATARDEENWSYVRFGKLVCRNIRLCDKCAVPTVDHETGVKVDSKADTMKKYRSSINEWERMIYGTNALFGNNLAPEARGEIVVGMRMDAAVKHQ